MKNILVTGGCGYIASHTCLLLLNKGYNVYSIDSCINSSPKALNNVLVASDLVSSEYKKKLHFYKGDIQDKNCLRKIFLEASNKNNNISSVIHFAGLKSVSESISEPIKYWNNNVCGTLSLLEVMGEFDCESIVFSSSASIYGYKDNDMIDEDSDINPTNPYGMTKYVIEKILNDLFLSSPKKLKIANLRYFNPIGAHSSGLIGEDPKGSPSNIFPLILKVASGKQQNLQVFGNDWDTPDGTGIRDYIHVMDLSEGHIKTLEFLEKSNSQIINLNLGTGCGTSVLELIKIFQEENNIEIPFVYAERRKGDGSKLVANNYLAKSILHWSPQRSIKTMCKDGWKWLRKNPNGY